MTGRPAPVEERFWRFVDAGSIDKCWLWRGCVTADGTPYMASREKQSYRTSWVIHWGALPPRTFVERTCNVRLCVNPFHLVASTNRMRKTEWIEQRKLAGKAKRKVRREGRERFWKNVSKDAQCWNWTGGKTADGYGTIMIDGKQCRAHQVSYQWHEGAIAKGMLVCHTCDNPSCVNPAHLFLGTHEDNMLDKVRKGRAWRGTGEKNPSAKLTRAQVAQIKQCRGTKTALQLAERFGVSKATITNIFNGRSWGDVSLAEAA